ncbi:MAG TPA: hypothetical protein VNZ55_09750, partial [Thermomicrobiales bacterium]|nr:hypothetical protein [Thermomicrobiales bacterium]
MAGVGAALFGAGSIQSLSAQPATPEATPVEPENPLLTTTPSIFKYDAFEFLFLLTLGATYEQGSDIGECFAAAAKVKDGDPDSWTAAWAELADRVHGIAETSDAAGHRISAREAYLRASNYYWAATFFSDGTSDPSQFVPTWEKHRASWEAFIARLDIPVETIEIPYEDTTLPGYAFTVDASDTPRPWIILNNGSDGTMADMWGQGGAAALRRGYNILMFDGPGQGASLYRHNLYFRPDWEAVVTPVVDYLLTRSDVDPDKIALQGVSQAGYWVPRAVAFEHRIAAAIADPGVTDVIESWIQDIPQEEMAGLFTAQGQDLEAFKQELDEAVAEGEKQSALFRFNIRFRMRPYGTTSFAETLLKLRDYSLDGITGKITCPIAIADPEGESFWPGQSQALYDAIQSPKALLTFTAAEGADLHCEPKALGLRSQRIFDWLDETLAMPTV